MYLVVVLGALATSANTFVVLISRTISHHFVARETEFRFKNRQQQMTAENKLEKSLLVQANIRFCFATAARKGYLLSVSVFGVFFFFFFFLFYFFFAAETRRG